MGANVGLPGVGKGVGGATPLGLTRNEESSGVSMVVHENNSLSCSVCQFTVVCHILLVDVGLYEDVVGADGADGIGVD